VLNGDDENVDFIFYFIVLPHLGYHDQHNTVDEHWDYNWHVPNVQYALDVYCQQARYMFDDLLICAEWRMMRVCSGPMMSPRCAIVMSRLEVSHHRSATDST